MSFNCILSDLDDFIEKHLFVFFEPRKPLSLTILVLLNFRYRNTSLNPLQKISHSITMLRRQIQRHNCLSSKRVNHRLRILKFSIKIAQHIALKAILALISYEDDRRDLGRKVDPIICPADFLLYVNLLFLLFKFLLSSSLFTTSAIEQKGSGQFSNF